MGGDIDITAYGDMVRRYAPSFVGQYQQQPNPVVEVTVYDLPTTVTELPQNHYRVAVWMPGEQHRTRPLVEQRFSHDDYHAAVMEAARTGNSHAYWPDGLAGPTQMFVIEWSQKNRDRILEAQDRRKGNAAVFTDLGDANTIPTRSFMGEDGRQYTELDLRGEETDPVLLDALAHKEAESKRLRELGMKRLREQFERHERNLQEMESLPGYGSF